MTHTRFFHTHFFHSNIFSQEYFFTGINSAPQRVTFSVVTKVLIMIKPITLVVFLCLCATLVHGFDESSNESFNESFNESVWEEADEEANEILDKIVPRIVGGQRAAPDEFPHQATIARRVSYFGQYSYQQICGASIISDRWLVTAAHCLPYLQNPLTRNSFRGIIGTHDLHHQGRQIVSFEKVIPHPSYSSRGHSHDIGLVKTSAPITESSSVRFVKLPKQGEKFTGMAVATGHGKTSTMGGESDVLIQVDIEIRDDRACFERYGPGFNPRAMICAGGRAARKATCMGDSGGPFVQKSSDGSYVLIGLTSFGPRNCATPFVPVVFTRVSSYVDWINRIIKNN